MFLFVCVPFKSRFYLEDFTWLYYTMLFNVVLTTYLRLISRAFTFLDFYRAHFNLCSQTVRNLIDSSLRICALYFCERRVRCSYRFQYDSPLRRSVPFSYQKFEETIDSHLLFPNSAIFEKRVAEISPELFAIVS